MRKTRLIFVCIALFLCVPISAQIRDDYLTPEEVEQARETQEPNKRIALFLGFAALRLSAFETAMAQKSASEDERAQKLDDFIRAVDDTADNVERPLRRGGVDLRKARVKILSQGEGFRIRLEAIQSTLGPEADEELRYALEDAQEAVEALIELGREISEQTVPEKVAPNTKDGDEPAPSGKPTLKRKGEKKDDKNRN